MGNLPFGQERLAASEWTFESKPRAAVGLEPVPGNSPSRGEVCSRSPIRGPRWRLAAAVAAGLGLMVAGVAGAQDFTMEWFALGAGGGQSSGGDFTLEGSIGEAEAGLMSGGDYELDGGFWGIIATLEAPGAPPLTLNVNGAQVTLSWPAGTGTDFVVEEATALAGAPMTTTWKDTNVAHQLINGMEVIQLPLASGNRFYRLRSL